MNHIKHRAEESLEDYLEAILMIEQKHGSVRSIDIVNELDITKPSVSVAMKNLREKQYITMDENNFIILTDSGRKRAEEVYERHITLTKLLIHFGVEESLAMQDACRVEHDISVESFEAIKSYVNNIKS